MALYFFEFSFYNTFGEKKNRFYMLTEVRMMEFRDEKFDVFRMFDKQWGLAAAMIPSGAENGDGK